MAPASSPQFLLFFPSPKIGTWVIGGLIGPPFRTSKSVVLLKEFIDPTFPKVWGSKTKLYKK